MFGVLFEGILTVVGGLILGIGLLFVASQIFLYGTEGTNVMWMPALALAVAVGGIYFLFLVTPKGFQLIGEGSNLTNMIILAAILGATALICLLIMRTFKWRIRKKDESYNGKVYKNTIVTIRVKEYFQKSGNVRTCIFEEFPKTNRVFGSDNNYYYSLESPFYSWVKGLRVGETYTNPNTKITYEILEIKKFNGSQL